MVKNKRRLKLVINFQIEALLSGIAWIKIKSAADLLLERFMGVTENENVGRLFFDAPLNRLRRGANIHDVMRRLATDCPHWKRNKRWPEGCGVYLPDLEPPLRPPDNPGGQAIRVIDGGKSLSLVAIKRKRA